MSDFSAISAIAALIVVPVEDVHLRVTRVQVGVWQQQRVAEVRIGSAEKCAVVGLATAPALESEAHRQLELTGCLRRNGLSEKGGRQRTDISGVVDTIQHVECVDPNYCGWPGLRSRLQRQLTRPAQVEVCVPRAFSAVARDTGRTRIRRAGLEIV
jgi:hypothetical protein